MVSNTFQKQSDKHPVTIYIPDDPVLWFLGNLTPPHWKFNRFISTEDKFTSNFLSYSEDILLD
jgi:hypothetical protein